MHQGSKRVVSVSRWTGGLATRCLMVFHKGIIAVIQHEGGEVPHGRIYLYMQVSQHIISVSDTNHIGVVGVYDGT